MAPWSRKAERPGRLSSRPASGALRTAATQGPGGLGFQSRLRVENCSEEPSRIVWMAHGYATTMAASRLVPWTFLRFVRNIGVTSRSTRGPGSCQLFSTRDFLRIREQFPLVDGACEDQVATNVSVAGTGRCP